MSIFNQIISNELPISSYSLIKRASVEHKLKQLVRPDHYEAPRPTVLE